MGATETRQKPTIRVLQPKGPVELFVGGRRIDLRTINGQQVEGIWIGKPAEGPDVLAESQAMKEARRKGLTLWGDTYIQGGRRELGNEFDDEITPSEVLQRYLSTRQAGEDDLSLGQQITEAFVEGKLMGDPHEIAAELDAERRVASLIEAAKADVYKRQVYGPLMALFLGGLANIWNAKSVHIPYIFDFSRVNDMAQVVYPTSINILYGGPAQQLKIFNTSNYVDTFAEYIISLIMLWVVLILPWWLLRIFRDYCCDAVSYTHLDVYKRQHIYTLISLCKEVNRQINELVNWNNYIDN